MNKKQFDDEILVNRYMKGDEECLAILLERHQKRIFTTILICVNYNHTYAEDIFQEALFKAVRALKAGNYIHQNYFAAWVEKIAKHLIIDEARKRRKFHHIAAVRNADGEYTNIFDIIKIRDEKLQEEVMIKNDENKLRRERMRALIQQLPPKFRDIVIMRIYFDMSFKEISSMMKININTALGRMRYGLIELREIIDREGLEITKEKIWD